MPVLAVPAKVTSIRQETPTVKVLSFNIKLNFKPGQFVMLSIPGYVDKTGKGPKRAYSIASPPEEPLELIIKINPAPSFSSAVDSLKVGDSVNVEGPYGKFVLQTITPNTVFIASGTGIAPLMSMIRHASKYASQKMLLIFGIKTLQNCLYKKELDNFNAKGVLDTVYCLSQEKREGFVHGRVTTILKDYVSAKNDIYICGSPEMVKDVVAVLLSQGIPAERIFKEQW